jgi:O-antigen/teichoic acid export membrane protein
LPLFILLSVAPESALRLFGAEFGAGADALAILLLGQLVNVATGAVGFILIMVGRTGWDLVVYAASVAFDIAIAVLLIGLLDFGIVGAAIAGAATMALSKVARLWLVWRFVGIQPYARDYLRLLTPTMAAVVGSLAVHLTLAGLPWQIDLLGTGGVVMAIYFPLLIVAGLPPAERRAALRLVAVVLGRKGDSSAERGTGRQDPTK